MAYTKRTSNSYMFTITDLNDPRLDELRERRRLDNIKFRKTVHPGEWGRPYMDEMKIRTRGRLGPNNPNRFNKKYRKIDARGRWVTDYQDVDRSHATRFDVYYEKSRRYI